jgi:hypothetical protein
VSVAAAQRPALAAFFDVREVADGRAVAGELFQHRYREPAPDFPHHVVGFWRDPGGTEHPACYIHFTALDEILLGGGACTDQRLLRRLPPDQRAALRAAGGVYQHCLTQAVRLFAPRHPAIFGYCGDALAERVDRAVGFQPTGHPHLLAYFTRPLAAAERARLVALAHAVGPF